MRARLFVAELVLVDTPSELELRIRQAREAVTAKYADSYAYIQSWVDKWIGVEHAVERASFSFANYCYFLIYFVLCILRTNKEFQVSGRTAHTRGPLCRCSDPLGFHLSPLTGPLHSVYTSTHPLPSLS